MRKIKSMLVFYEGERGLVYECPAGKLTISVGYNLEAAPLDHDIIMLILERDIEKLLTKFQKLSWFTVLNDARQDVILNMAFNMGVAGVLEFKKMIAAIKERNFEEAEQQGLDSRWAQQVGPRAIRLMTILRRAEYGNDYPLH